MQYLFLFCCSFAQRQTTVQSDTCLHPIKFIPWSSLISIQAHTSTAVHAEEPLRPLSHLLRTDD
jgi:hypothetical protein